MTRPPPLICLITPGHLASTPRLLKEANALAAAGWRVHVVAGRNLAPVDRLDQSVLATATWSCSRVACHAGVAAFVRKAARRIVRRIWPRLRQPSLALAARAQHAHALALASSAARVPADFYLGHCVAGLAAAAFAARRRGKPHGFDIEDLHDDETHEATSDRIDAAAVRILQDAFLPGCAHVTASSPLIAADYAARYGVRPLTVLNVFPRAEAPVQPTDPGEVGPKRPARFYWFSQTIGPGRGLEAVIAILAAMRTPAELHLRGFVSDPYAAGLRALAADSPLRDRIVFLPPAEPSAMARMAADADLGLSTEQPPPRNHDVCLGNKIFTYLLAGVPVLFSNTAAQTALSGELGRAALLVDLARPEEAAARLDAVVADSAQRRAARQAAWVLAQTRYCWDVAQLPFLDSVRRVVAP